MDLMTVWGRKKRDVGGVNGPLYRTSPHFHMSSLYSVLHL